MNDAVTLRNRRPVAAVRAAVDGVNILAEQPEWPESWRLSHSFDKLELHGSREKLGYTYAYEARRALILDTICSLARAGDSIIDVAAAQGNFCIALAKAGFSVTWNDIRADLIDFVKLKYPQPGITFRPGNLFELDASLQYDVALVAEVIEHVAHPDQFLAQVAKVTRAGGYIVLTTPNGRYVRNRLPRFSACRDFTEFEKAQFKPDADGHLFLLHSDEIRDLAAACGLDVVSERYYANPLTAGYLRTAGLLRFLPRALVDRIERWTGRLPRPLSERVNTGVVALLRKR